MTGEEDIFNIAAVNENCRKQGIGTKLPDAVYESMKEEGINKVLW